MFSITRPKHSFRDNTYYTFTVISNEL